MTPWPVLRLLRLLVLAAAIGAGVAGCASRVSAPVVERTSQTARPALPATAAPVPVPVPGPLPAAPNARGLDATVEFYTVRRGDTLVNIALDSGHDYREIAEWNGIANPNLIREGQVLRLTPPGGAGAPVRAVPGSVAVDARPAPQRDSVKSEPKGLRLPYSEENLAMLSRESSPAQPLAAKPGAAEPKPPAPEQKPPPQRADADADDEKIEWGWPTTGRVVAGFSETTNKGLDIGGKRGQAVLASATGTVLYVGSGIRGYGKLIVIRHSRTYSTVYAHNSEIMVKEGQRVVKGQKVAEMGNTDADQVKLHFEIRRLGKPTDPTKLLPDKAS